MEYAIGLILAASVAGLAIVIGFDRLPCWASEETSG